MHLCFNGGTCTVYKIERVLTLKLRDKIISETKEWAVSQKAVPGVTLWSQIHGISHLIISSGFL